MRSSKGFILLLALCLNAPVQAQTNQNSGVNWQQRLRQINNTLRHGSEEDVQDSVRKIQRDLARQLQSPTPKTAKFVKALLQQFPNTDFAAAATEFAIQRQIVQSGEVNAAHVLAIVQFAETYPASTIPIIFCEQIADHYVNQNQTRRAISFLDQVCDACGDLPKVGRLKGKHDFLVRSALLASAPTSQARRAKKKSRPSAFNFGGSKHSHLLGQNVRIDGKTLSHGTVSSQGQWTAAVFWATWCGACRNEVPKLADVSAELQRNNISLLGVNMDRDADAAKKFVSSTGVSWPNIFQRNPDESGWDNPIVDRLGIKSIPAVVLIDPSGKVVMSHGNAQQLVEAAEQIAQGR